LTKSYRYAIVYFLLFSFILLASASALFEIKIGFSPLGIMEYYNGNEEKFIPAKSFSGILKTALSHIFVFGLFIMVLLHFIVFTGYKNRAQTRWIIYLTFSTALIELSCAFFILSGYIFFAYLKVLSFVLFEFLILYIIWLLLMSIFYKR